jgi:hypothetical protein
MPEDIDVPPPPPPTLSDCLCPDDTCDDLGCVDPTPNWWVPPPPPLPYTTTNCPLVVDVELGLAGFAGTVFAQTRECKSTDVARVIDIDDDWVIDVHITLTGPTPNLICGLWCVSACLESMCGPTYYRFPRDSDIDSPPPPSPYCCCLVETNQFTSDYDIRICIPAGVVTESECGAPYELTVIVTLLSRDQMKAGDKCDPGTYMPLGVATACELPLMTFYDGG